MNYLKSRWLAAGLGLVFLAGLTNPRAAEQDKSKEEPKTPASKPAAPAPKAPNRPTTPAARPKAV